MNNTRFDRNILFFGKEGQKCLSDASVAVVGVGGLGTHVVQQLALLGVGRLVLIDSEELDNTNRNRYVGVRHDDPVPGTPKVAIGERLALEINPQIKVLAIARPLADLLSFQAIISESNFVFGCLDNDGARLVLNELCLAYEKPYFDLASGIDVDQGRYGGRVCVRWKGAGCLVCHGLLDPVEAGMDLQGDDQRKNREAVYGMPIDSLGAVGPSVVSINGIVASLGVTEFMLVVSGVRSEPKPVLTYHGDRGVVLAKSDPPRAGCFFCSLILGKGEGAQVQRYLSEGSGEA